MNNREFSLPVYIAKGVATSGFFYDLGPLSISIYDKKTNAVATAAGNGTEFFLAGGSPHTKDELTPFYKGMKHPKKSAVFQGKDIMSFQKSYPQRPRNEEWTLGYGGAASDNGLVYECGRTYQLKIRLYGEPAFRLAGKSMEKVISLVTPCCDTDCTSGCTDDTIDPKIQTKKWVEQINNNSDLKGWKLKAQPIFDDYAASATTAYRYTLTVKDDGSVEALADVQRAASAYLVTRLSYDHGTSVYEVAGYTSAPSSFTAKTYSIIADCGTCPAGYTLVAGFDSYIISRQLNTTTDLDDTASQTTFAGVIVTAYSGVSGSGVYLGFRNGAAYTRINVTSGATVNIASGTADTVEKIASTPTICTPAAASAVAWAQSGTGYTATRSLTVTIGIDDCASAITAAALNTAMIAAMPSYVASSATDASGSGDPCVKVFTITQRSKFMEDSKCESPDNAIYDSVPSFHGQPFVEVAPTPGDTTVKAGIRFTAPFYSASFDDCSYDPNEYADAIPLRMEVSIYDQNMNPCTFSELAKARRVIAPRYRKFAGSDVRREYIMEALAGYFTYEQFEQDPRSRQIIDDTTLGHIHSSSYYVAYYLKFKENVGNHNFNQKKQVWEPVIYVEDGDIATQVAFEKAILAVTAKFGVSLTQRG